jgi:hypothetical protein
MSRSVIILTSFVLMVSAHASNAECTCIFAEGAVKEGETACIWSARGKTLARCEKVLNVTSWKLLDQACPLEQSRRLKPDREITREAG